MINIYTDGSCKNNPGRGGWASIIVRDNGRHVISGSEVKTTNNRMELTAAIKGLETTSEGEVVAIYSDSQYLVNTMTKGWKRKSNMDLWNLLDELTLLRTVKWQWVRGHSGILENEEANTLAGKEAGIIPFSSTLTHLSPKGTARMVDIGGKTTNMREAVARGFVEIDAQTLSLISEGKIAKGDVFATARVAGILAAKNTPHLIPLCHPIPLTQVTVDIKVDEQNEGLEITSKVNTEAKTGVEMEAMTAVSITALTIYDMCKSENKEIRVRSIRLISKTGGKSGDLVLET